MKEFIGALHRAFVRPTSRQREAYGRLFHNLAAASLIGCTTILFTENRYGVLHGLALLTVGVICFAIGALLIDGD